MLSAPQGPITLAESLLAASLAACPRWQMLCGVDNAADAAKRIYTDALPPPPDRRDAYSLLELEQLRPFILIYTDEDTGLAIEHIASGRRRQFAESGQLKFHLEKSVPAVIAHDPAEVDRRIKNDAGVLIEELLKLAGDAHYLAIDSLAVTGPLRSDDDEATAKGDYQQMHFVVRWGGR